MAHEDACVADKLIRQTKSVCPVCIAPMRADIIEREGSVYLVKECQQHGDFKLLLSRHPWYYRQLNDFYFSVMGGASPQQDYIIHLTNTCNLNCPICLAQANQRPEPDYPRERLHGFLKGKRNLKIDLMGAEPTMRQDLPELISMVRKSGNRAALHTNGIAIAEFSYLQCLRDAGLSEVHLQFDGFDDRVYEKIRGRSLLQIKLKALANLEKLDVATDLKVTVVRGVNELQMSRVIDFAVGHPFIKEVFFLGCRYLGRAKDLPIENCLMPDELIDMLEAQTGRRISRQSIFAFQKLYFSLLANFSVRKCFYNQHFLIARKNGSYVPIDQIIDLDAIQRDLDVFRKLRTANKRAASFYLPLALLRRLIGTGLMSSCGDVLAMARSFRKGFDLSRLREKYIVLGFISACDAHSFDYQIAQHCGKGAVSWLGIREIGAVDNVMRDTYEDSRAGQ